MHTRFVPTNNENTFEAAAILTFLKMHKQLIRDIDRVTAAEYGAIWWKAMEYLHKMEATVESDPNVFHAFLGVLKDTKEEIMQVIRDNKQYVTQCACMYFAKYSHLIVSLDEFLEVHEEHSVGSVEVKEEHIHVPTEAVPSPELMPPAPLLELKQREREEAINIFCSKVQMRLKHLDQAADTKIRIILQQTLDKSISTEQAKREMSLLLQHHNYLWKEFEQFLPEEHRAGSSTAAIDHLQ